MDSTATATPDAREIQSGVTLVIEGAHFARQTLVTLSSTITKYGPAQMRYLPVDHPRYGETETYADCVKRNNGKAVWLSAQPTVIAAREYHAQLAAERANDVPVVFGDVIRVVSGYVEESGLWRIVKPGPMGGDHCQLIRVEG